MRDYSKYELSKREKIKYGFVGYITVASLIQLFYGRIILSVLLGGLGIFYIPYKRKVFIKEGKKKLRAEFKEGLYALSSSINVGKSIEQAFIEAVHDLKVIYLEEDTYIVKEFETIVRKISMNEPVENALLDFALRSQDEDIENFANVFITAKRSGGNLVEIMKFTTNSINEKIEIMENIEIMITGKKYEQRLLAFLLPMIILYLQFFSTGFLEVLYHTLVGRLAMTIALALYIISFIFSKKIVEIQV